MRPAAPPWPPPPCWAAWRPGRWPASSCRGEAGADAAGEADADTEAAEVEGTDMDAGKYLLVYVRGG